MLSKPYGGDMKFNLKQKPLILLLTFYLVIFLTFSGCTGSHLIATSYQQSDFQGAWTMIGFGYKGKEPFNTLSSLDINNTGTVIGGDTVEFGYDTKVFTGGRLLFSQEDTLTGEINTYLPDVDLHDKHGIVSGKMHKEKDLIVFSGRFPVFHRGIGILIKKWQNYEQSDIVGTWAFPINNDMLTVLINHSGNINECAIPSSNESVICSGTIIVNSDGVITGQIAYKDKKDNFEISFNGQMNKNKNIMIFAGSISTSFEGFAAFAIKKENKSSLTDIKGDWRIYMTADGDAIYGKIALLDGGVISSGNLKQFSGSERDFNGEILIDKGDISGFFKTDPDNNIILLKGHLNSERDFGGGIYKDNHTNSGIFVLIRDFKF